MITGSSGFCAAVRIVAQLMLGSTLLLQVGCSRSLPALEFIGKPAPAARFTMMDGSRVTLQGYHGKTVVMVFWQLSCPKSKRLLPRLREVAAPYGPNSSTVFIVANLDELPQLPEVEKRIAELGATSLQFAFSGNEAYDEAFRLFEGHELPLVIVVNPSGEVVAAGRDIGVVQKALYKPGLSR